MSRHNYSQYSNKNYENYNAIANETVEPVVNETATATVATVVDPVVETVETVTLPETVEGVVVGCTKLNVRANPDATADVVCVIDAAAEININVEKSTNDWFYVCTAAGIEGYCMRKFVTANL